MIPLRDSTHSRTFPFVTVSIIIINLLVYLYEASLSQADFNSLIYRYSLIPALFTENLGTFFPLTLFHPPLVTSIFLHGSWFHVISNMLYLWIFGDNIEDRLGHMRFLLFYLLAGIIANLFHIMTDLHSPIPLVGASGAIAGILGAYFITFPKARITTLIFIFFFFTIRPIRTIYFLLFWFLIQIFNGINSLGTVGTTVAWWAHVGGFLAGIALMILLRRRNRPQLYP